MSVSTYSFQIEKYQGIQGALAEDLIAVEAPLEIRLQYIENDLAQDRSIAITMRTPGDDAELAMGFLIAEHIIDTLDAVDKIEQQNDEIINVLLKSGYKCNLEKSEKNFITNSSCGVCGKSSIEAIYQKLRIFTLVDESLLDISICYGMPERLLEIQSTFQLTGGVHAATLFDSNGNYLLHREDVGRHNALDKLIGACAYKQMVLAKTVLLLSGRVSFELMQKANIAGISIVVALGAPSSLAVDMAAQSNMTLIGFLKSNRLNIYHRQH